MAWIIDTDVLIEGERGHPAFLDWLQKADAVATADVVRGEYLLGTYAVPDETIRQRSLKFYTTRMTGLPSFSSESGDYPKAAVLAGEARRQGKGKPGLVDGLIAVIALRTGATVATQNTKDFIAMGCPCANPLLPGGS
jgi:predicted nucleic acid-binding protein